MRRISNLEKFRQEIREAGKIRDQERVASEQAPKIDSEITILESSAQTTRRQFQDQYERRTGEATQDDPFTVRPEHYLSIVLLIGAVVVIILEILVSIPIAQSWLNVPPAGAFAIGASVGIMLSLAFKAGIGVVCRVDNHLAPQAPRRRLWVVTTVNFIITAALIAFILSSRSPSESVIEFIETVTGLSLGILGIALPLFAGSLMILAHDLDWSHRFDDEYHTCLSRLGELRGYLAYLAGYRTTTSVGAATTPPQTNP